MHAKQTILLIALCTSIVLALLAHAGVFSLWNLRLTDALYGDKPQLENIVIIAVDDASLQEIGRWPWKRTVYLDLLLAIRTAQVTAFDIGFFEPTNDDALLGDALRKAGNIIIAKEFDFSRDTALMPVNGLEDIQTGMVNIYTDPDGTSRSVPISVGNEPGLAYAIARDYLGTEMQTPDNRLLVNFAGSPGTYRTYSAADVIRGRVNKTSFDDAIVLIGATAPDLHDEYLVPTSHGRRMPGVEIHAHAVQTILTRQFLSHQSPGSLALVILSIALLAGILYSTLRIRTSAIVLGMLAIAYFLTAVFMFRQGTVLNLVYPPLTIILTSLTAIAGLAASEAKHKKYILGVFGRYVSKDVVRHLLKSEKAIELGGVEQEVTALFADIRGFTAMSEKMKPGQVIKVLNHYFGDMTDAVFAQGGTLDKFIGDALFALWGTPLEDPEHALKAVRCALAIQKQLRTRHAKGIPPIRLGIGIASGLAVVGNMGGPQRQEFTAIGDTINTASRLSGHAQGGQILITDATYQRIKEHIRAKKLPPLAVKGKAQLLVVHEVLGLRGQR